MAFLALVHRFNPEKTKVDFNSHTRDNPEHNLSVAFELAEQELGIPKLLDAKEVFEGRVDERSLVLYTSLFFHAFKAAAVAQELQLEKESTAQTLDEERRQHNKLKHNYTELQAELEALRLRLERLEEEKNEVTLHLNEKEETTLQLKRVVEEERSETSIRLDDYQKKNLELSEQLHEEQTRRLELESKVSDLSSSLNENQETNLQVITELRNKKALYEEEIESLKNDVENFKVQLDNERKENNQHNQALQERTEQDTFHRKGLQVLHKNLDEHIADLHTWQKYLDNKDRNWLDFDRDVRPSLNNELSTRSDFIEELNLLSDKLEQENEAMLQILKAKLAEAKNAQLDAAKDTKK